MSDPAVDVLSELLAETTRELEAEREKNAKLEARLDAFSNEIKALGMGKVNGHNVSFNLTVTERDDKERIKDVRVST